MARGFPRKRVILIFCGSNQEESGTPAFAGVTTWTKARLHVGKQRQIYRGRSARIPFERTPGQDRDHRLQADGDAARSEPRLFAGRRRSGARDRRQSRPAPTIYTAKGNLVAVISNGTAILGLGNLGALASKPVMEGKAVLFKRFADVDAIDIEVATEDAQRFIDCVELLEPSFGGINLEDIAAPDCFVIEQTLKERMNIPVFHDDQHGTAIITAAGLINACHLTGRKMGDIKVVVNGAGAAAIACTELIKAMGVKRRPRHHVRPQGRHPQGPRRTSTSGSRRTRSRPTRGRWPRRCVGADVFLGLSAAGALKPEMVEGDGQGADHLRHGQSRPGNPPPEDAQAARPDAIIATGRSDYPNQVNNVLGFPFIFRGALDVRATAINDEMKIAAADALAELAREPVPEEVAAAYGGRTPSFGRDYIIPAPFDPRLMEVVASAVAEAAGADRRRAKADRRHGRVPAGACAPASTRRSR